MVVLMIKENHVHAIFALLDSKFQTFAKKNITQGVMKYDTSPNTLSFFGEILQKSPPNQI